MGMDFMVIVKDPFCYLYGPRFNEGLKTWYSGKPPVEWEGGGTDIGSIVMASFDLRRTGISCYRKAKEGELRSSDGTAGVGDTILSPELFHNGSFYPICSSDSDNVGKQNLASTICQEMGFQMGGQFIQNDMELAVDGYMVGKCEAGGALQQCSGAHAVASQDGTLFCKAGNAKGVSVRCYHECRPFQNIELEAGVCSPYLNNDTIYYRRDQDFRVPELFPALIGQFFQEDCLHNAMRVVCSHAFRECHEVEEGRWLPPLLCRTECDQRMSIWNQCVEGVENDADT